jgi:gamma-glutamyltranspeptidase/glutathione hydrolase/leukotriene-C4 hydrolase
VVLVIVVLAVTAGLLYYFLTKESDQSSGGPYKREAVATDTQKCSEIGKDILNANGSAVDAAIAAMFCLGVISMHSSGIGGGGVMLVYNRSLQEVSVIDFRETAPAGAYSDMFKGNEKKAQKGILFRFVFSEDFFI